MNTTVMVDCNESEATAIYCEDHEDSETQGEGFFEGEAEMKKHQDAYPFHYVTFLRREVV